MWSACKNNVITKHGEQANVWCGRRQALLIRHELQGKTVPMIN
jgi:hypothetical protein